MCRRRAVEIPDCARFFRLVIVAIFDVDIVTGQSEKGVGVT